MVQSVARPGDAQQWSPGEVLDNFEQRLLDIMGQARLRWMFRDPELRRALGDLAERVTDLRRLLDQQRPAWADAELRRLEHVEKKHLLHLDSAYALYNSLGHVVLQIAPDAYVAVRGAGEALRRDDSGKRREWPPAVVEVIDHAQHGALDTALVREALLFRHEQYTRQVLHGQARRRTRSRLLLRVVPVLVVLVAGFGVLIDRVVDTEPQMILLAAVAGALGATLSGIFKLRDVLKGLGEVRAFGVSMVIQPLIGAAFALFVVVVVDAGFAGIALPPDDREAAFAFLGFLAGFSEPFALGIVQRVTALDSASQSDTPTQK